MGCRIPGRLHPAEHLQRFLAADPPAAAAVSCTVPLHLPGARRAVAACHAASVPVLAGGAAFGTAPNLAALGADAWAPTPQQAAAIFTRWASNRPPLAVPLADDGPALAVAAERPRIVERAMSMLARRFPPLAHYTSQQLARTREDLGYIIQFVEAVLLAADATIITDFRRLANVDPGGQGPARRHRRPGRRRTARLHAQRPNPGQPTAHDHENLQRDGRLALCHRRSRAPAER
jgi:hypothetical protein